MIKKFIALLLISPLAFADEFNSDIAKEIATNHLDNGMPIYKEAHNSGLFLWAMFP